MQTQNNTLTKLSRREIEILGLIAQGLKSQEIADKIYVSKNTVDSHRRNMMRKQKVKRCKELIPSHFGQRI